MKSQLSTMGLGVSQLPAVSLLFTWARTGEVLRQCLHTCEKNVSSFLLQNLKEPLVVVVCAAAMADGGGGYGGGGGGGGGGSFGGGTTRFGEDCSRLECRS